MFEVKSGEDIIAPQPGPQTILLASQCQENFFGGALGAGKSFGIALDYGNQFVKHGKYVNGIIFRESLPELEDLIKKFKQVLFPLGFDFQVGTKTFKHPNGAECRMAFVETADDVNKYWGHEYCVGKGTPILMSDGSYKPIEGINVGDLVMTLEGAKRVTATTNAMFKESVLAEIFDVNGTKLGEQIHPSNHPLLASISERLRSKHHSSQTSEQSRRHSFHSWTSYESLLREYQGNQDCAFSSVNVQSDYAVSEDGSPKIQQPLSLTCPVVLHEPSLRSVRANLLRPTQTHSLRKSKERFWETRFLDRSEQNLDRLHEAEQPQLSPASGVWITPDGVSCAPLGSGRASNFHRRYSADQGQHGELLPPLSGIALADAPFVSGAEEPVLAGQRLDGMGNTQQCSPHSPSFEYIHPYTSMLRDVVEKIEIGSCRMTPVGVHEVYDLCVEDANHYITDTACINKNSYMAFDEFGNVKKVTWDAVHKLRAMRLRSPYGVPIKFVATGNPCGKAHELCFERYINSAPAFVPHRDTESNHWIVFIPGKMENNPKLLENDPEYKERIKSGAPAHVVKAMLEGDWTIPPQGNVFLREYFKNRIVIEDKKRISFGAHSWDTAFKTTKDSARSAVTGWYEIPDGFFINFGWAGKVEFPEMKAKLENYYYTLLPDAVWIEDKASGQSLTQALKADSRIPVKAIPVDGDKLRRAYAITPLFESGKIFLPESKSATWDVDEWIDELCGFPNTGYADFVDSTSQALNQLVLRQRKLTRFQHHRKPMQYLGSLYGV